MMGGMGSALIALPCGTLTCSTFCCLRPGLPFSSPVKCLLQAARFEWKQVDPGLRSPVKPLGIRASLMGFSGEVQPGAPQGGTRLLRTAVASAASPSADISDGAGESRICNQILQNLDDLLKVYPTGAISNRYKTHPKTSARTHRSYVLAS